MRKRKSIYQFLIVIMMISLLLPIGAGQVSAGKSHGGDKGEKGSLTIHKFEQEPGAEQGDNPDGSKLPNDPDGKALKGVTFTLTQTHSYDQTTDKWTEVDGEPFTRITDENGEIHLTNIDLGRYKVQETSGPDHVVLNETKYSVDIPMTDPNGTFQNYDVHVYPKNETIRGEVKLKKKDGNSKNGLSGVTFNLYNEVGDIVGEGLKTNSHGFISAKNLEFGKYYFQETATVDGYLLNSKKVEFSIDKQGKKAKVYLNNFKKPEIDKDIDKYEVNRGEKVRYTLTIELPEDIASYKNFKVTDVLHENLEYVDGSQSNPDGFTFDKDGQTLTWTADPSQLESGTIEITFDAEISKDATANEPINNVAEIDYNNGYVTDKDKSEVPVLPTAGTLKVLKQDGDSKVALKGAEFNLVQGETVIGSGTTGENGILDFGELDYGEYQLVETKAPDGYNKLTNPIDVTVNAKTSEHIITVDNFKSGWELPKTGGMGTLFFTLIGLTFMGAALFMYIRRRRGESA